MRGAIIVSDSLGGAWRCELPGNGMATWPGMSESVMLQNLRMLYEASADLEARLKAWRDHLALSAATATKNSTTSL